MFTGTLEDAENIKDWASGTEISWVPLDDAYTDPMTNEPDLSKGVSLDVFGALGMQFAHAGDYLVKDAQGITVFTVIQFRYYFEETSDGL